MAATTGARGRGKSGRGVTWAALGLAALVFLGLAFGLGVLAGRQWTRQTTPAAPTEPARRTASSPRRGASDWAPPRVVEPQERLTFYQTLTAPLDSASVSKPQPVARPHSEQTDPAAPRPPAREVGSITANRALAGATGAERSKPAPSAAADAPVAAADAPARPAAEERREAALEWTVQVGVFRNAQHAERIRRDLADGGFSAQVTTVSGDDGQTRYRVRLSGFRSKDEATKMADRVRSDRALPTYVTAK